MSNIKITLFDGRVEEYERGTSLLDIAVKHQNEYMTDILIGKVNNDLVELNQRLYEDSFVDFLTLECYEARRIYVRGLTFVLIRAVKEIFPGASVSIEHSLSKGIYCEIKKKPELSGEDITLIEKRMREIIAEDIPFEKENMTLEKAKEVFSKYGMKDKLRLFKYWDEDMVDVFKCGYFYGYFYGKMVPSTGYLKMFELMYYKPGLILRHPDTYCPQEIPEFKEQRGLFQVFREAEEWADILDVADVGALNDKTSSREMGEIIRISEALHEKKIAYIADMIASRQERVKLVLIAGPSSSGKTTFSKRLSIQLRVNGLKPYAISLDDYFVNREDTPRDEMGEYDFESIYALDLNLLNEHLNMLMAGEEVELPTFNFITGKREFNGNKLRLKDDMILVAEGIHGLNEVLTRDIKPENKFKIYVSALTQLNIDNHNRIPTTDVRILRRIVRDYRTRGKEAETTLNGWSSLRRGEDKNIFPFQEEADIMFNSTLVYELGALKKYAEPLLMDIKNTSRAYSEATRLLKFLNFFLPVGIDEIPNNSIIREFIGGSCFYKE